ncbi:MAG: MerR family DNA-binding protein [Gemmatimonadales bacterium]
MVREHLRIGAVALQAGVNVQPLRYYEQRGLLGKPERTPSGYREYPPQAVQVVRFIKRAQDLGFTLNEIADLMRLRQTRGRDRRRVRALAAAKLADIKGKIRHLQSMRRALATLVESCECAGAELECPILEALDDDPGPSR